MGYRDYGAYDLENSINQRESDIYGVFNEIIDYILKAKPDLVIHAGDLFDNQRPTNRAISVAMQGLSKLAKKEIPVVVIAGNHSTPRDRSTPSILGILNYFPGIHSIHQGKYEKISIGKCLIHAIPHMYSNEELHAAITKLKPDDAYKYNILVTHAAIKGNTDIMSKEFKEQTIPRSFLSKKFSYIALGHYHKYIKIQDNAYYCGSPEKFSFNEESYNNGFLEVELDGFDIKHNSTNTRPMKTIKINCEGLESENIMNFLEKKIHDVDGKIIKIVFDNIKKHAYYGLDQYAIKNMVVGATHYEPQINMISEDDGVIQTMTPIGDIKSEYEAYIEKQDMPEKDKKTMLSLGLEYLDEVMAD